MSKIAVPLCSCACTRLWTKNFWKFFVHKKVIYRHRLLRFSWKQHFFTSGYARALFISGSLLVDVFCLELIDREVKTWFWVITITVTWKIRIFLCYSSHHFPRQFGVTADSLTLGLEATGSNAAQTNCFRRDIHRHFKFRWECSLGRDPASVRPKSPPHGASESALNCEKRVPNIRTREETAVQAVVGSIVLAFRRLESEGIGR